MTKLGKEFEKEVKYGFERKKLDKELSIEGNDWWPRLCIKDTELNQDVFNSLLRQEFLSKGLFFGASLNLCHSHIKENIQSQTLKKFESAIDIFKYKKTSKNPEKYLRGKKLSLFLK